MSGGLGQDGSPAGQPPGRPRHLVGQPEEDEVVRFVALFRTPEDPAEFDRHYFGGHLPLVHAIPGLSRVSVQRVSRMLGGEPAFHLMAQLEFADAAALRAALHSEEWRRLGADLTSWGGDRLAVMFTAEEATTG